MSKKISFTFTENGAKAIAELLEDQAPRTCTAIWKSLEKPIRNKGIHAMFAGREVEFDLPAEAQVFDGASIPRENATCRPMPGDVGFGYIGPYGLPDCDRTGPPEEAIYDVAIFYGPGCYLLVPGGLFPMNIFARITEGLGEFAEMCAKVRLEGLKEIVVTRVEE